MLCADFKYILVHVPITDHVSKLNIVSLVSYEHMNYPGFITQSGILEARRQSKRTHHGSN